MLIERNQAMCDDNWLSDICHWLSEFDSMEYRRIRTLQRQENPTILLNPMDSPVNLVIQWTCHHAAPLERCAHFGRPWTLIDAVASTHPIPDGGSHVCTSQYSAAKTRASFSSTTRRMELSCLDPPVLSCNHQPPAGQHLSQHQHHLNSRRAPSKTESSPTTTRARFVYRKSVSYSQKSQIIPLCLH